MWTTAASRNRLAPMALSPTSSRGTAGVTVAAYAQITADVTLTATTGAGATTVVTAPAFTADGTTLYTFEFFTPWIGIAASTDFGIIELWDGSTELGWWGIRTGAGGIEDTPLLLRRYLTPTAGSHTYSARGWKSGVVVVHAGAGTVGVGMPTYLRVTSGA